MEKGGITVEASVSTDIVPKITTKINIEGPEIQSSQCLSDKCDKDKFVAFFEEYYVFFDESGQQNVSRSKVIIFGSIIKSTLVLTPSFINFNLRSCPKDSDKPFNGQIRLRVRCKNSDGVRVQTLPEAQFQSYWEHVKVMHDFTEIPQSFQVFGEILFDFIPGKPRNWGILKPSNAEIENKTKKDDKDATNCFTIFCHNQKWNFDKLRLSQVSPVFKAMIENSSTIEAQENSLKIDDASIQTLDIFHDLMSKWTDTAMYEICMGFTNFGKTNTSYDDDTIIDLLVFADKYLMQPLIDLCINLLTLSLCNENVLEMLKIAHFLSNQKLLKIATTYSINFKDELTEKQKHDWNDFIAKNPDCIAKMITSMILKWKRCTETLQIRRV